MADVVQGRFFIFSRGHKTNCPGQHSFTVVLVGFFFPKDEYNFFHSQSVGILFLKMAFETF